VICLRYMTIMWMSMLYDYYVDVYVILTIMLMSMLYDYYVDVYAI